MVETTKITTPNGWEIFRISDAIQNRVAKTMPQTSELWHSGPVFDMLLKNQTKNTQIRHKPGYNVWF